jgi:glycogen debranching enzyme
VDEVIQVDNQFYIRATSARLDGRTRVLKRNETFAVCDRFGDMPAVGFPELGLYHEGTRFLSRLSLTLDGQRPLLLSSGVREDNAAFVAHLTNADRMADGQIAVPRGTLHVTRECWTFSGGLGQIVSLRHYGLEPMDLAISIAVDADFADVFEVRGTPRVRRGRRLPALPESAGLRLCYSGCDGVLRETQVLCDPPPFDVESQALSFRVRLAPGEKRRFLQTIYCQASDEERSTIRLPSAARASAAASSKARASVRTSHEAFNAWIDRSDADLRMMTTSLPSGPYPFAGVPWFCTPFGRDGIITALETLWLDPDLGRGVLSFLAETQADDLVPERDAEPGKILHEARKGEMAALDEIPFRRYYGSVDATPLFVILAAAYHERVGDREFLEALWPHVERAIEWIDVWGDRDGDGFVEYFRQSEDGLVHQGWKDASDSIFHTDGSLAEGPIALSEVQGYVYAARRGAATLCAALGRDADAAALDRAADSLRARFDEAFWCDDIGAYALALDGRKQPCRVVASNAGQVLMSGIALPERAARLARTLFAPACFGGWGIRTVASDERRYNPMSYHDGSVWPHDNALIAWGLARSGFRDLAARLMSAFLDVSKEVEMRRLPELFCGFERREGEGPTLYPLACAPQSWAAGSVFLFLQSCLGIRIEAETRRIVLDRPHLPAYLDSVRFENVGVGDRTADFTVRREGDRVRVDTRRLGHGIQVALER